MSRRISEYVTRAAFLGTEEDAHGNEGESWGAGSQVGVYAFDPGSTSEPRDGGDRVIVEPTVYMPSKTVFNPRDKITARGVEYEVEGVTREWRHPNGPRKGNVATLRAVSG